MHTPAPPGGNCSRLIRFIVPGILIFGLLMALRYELPSVWLRALTAGVAFLVLGGALWFGRRKD